MVNFDLTPFHFTYPPHVRFSVGIHPWSITENWQETFALVEAEAEGSEMWAIGECGLDKVSGGDFFTQMEVFKAHIQLSESLQKPLIIHCVKAHNEMVSLRQQLEAACKKEGREPQSWVIHGFRGKPELAKQLMAKGIMLSFGHQYNVETLRFVFATGHPFFLETDDLDLSVRQIYEQVAHHLDVDVARLETLCDPLQTVFHRTAF